MPRRCNRRPPVPNSHAGANAAPLSAALAVARLLCPRYCLRLGSPARPRPRRRRAPVPPAPASRLPPSPLPMALAPALLSPPAPSPLPRLRLSPLPSPAPLVAPTPFPLCAPDCNCVRRRGTKRASTQQRRNQCAVAPMDRPRPLRRPRKQLRRLQVSNPLKGKRMRQSMLTV